MRKLLLLTLLLFITVGISLSQSIFTPEYSGDPSSHRTTEDPRTNALINDYMGTTTGYPPASGFAGQQALRIPASANGVGDFVRGINPPRAVGVEDNGQVRASNIVARIRGEQSQPQAQQKKK